jgi:hypothetical protein
MSYLYDDDVVAWAEQQASLLRAGRWSELDIDNIAEEIEDVGKSEKRELQSRLALLIAHLLKWAYQHDMRGHSWVYTIREQRAAIRQDLIKGLGLKPLLTDIAWVRQTYRYAKIKAYEDTHDLALPDELPWTIDQILSPDFMPGGGTSNLPP